MHKWSCNLLTKAQLRKILSEKRRAISLEDRRQAAQDAAQLFISSPLFYSSQHIGCYLPSQAEFDCMPMIEKIWQAKKHCYLPVLSETEKNFLRFANYQTDTPLRPNQYNILEPEAKENFPTRELDLVLVPLVGFDLKGHRLGMGGGYYDRSFAFLLDEKIEKPFLMGLAYELQCVDELPSEAWDVGLDGVVTEKRLIKIC